VVEFFDYRPLHRQLASEIDEAIHRVLDSGQLILGAEVRAFEQEFGDYVDVPRAVGVASGTDALMLALRALEIEPGDEVITVANAGVPTVAAIRAAGGTPRFVDVLPDTLSMDPERLEDARSPRTRAVVPVHLFGQPAAIDAISAFTSRHGLRLVEDCAQAHGARYRGRHVGRFGDVGCFSFYPTKNLGAFGDGGMAVTADARLAERLHMLRTYGYRDDRHAHVEGFCSRLDEIQAAVLRVRLRHLDAALEARRDIARRYRDGLQDSSFRLPPELPDSDHAYHLFAIQVPERDRAREALKRAGIGTAIHYPEPVHRMEAYRFLGYAEGDLPVSEASARSLLSLPCYPGLGAEAVDRVVEALRSAL
jgi:dTDP-4-amino-4,6-dideoxygalactose transaminase